MSGQGARSKHPQEPIRMVAFLGNPGRQYTKTRHNVGFMLADRVSREGGWAGGVVWKAKFNGQFARRQDGAVLLRPETFMNKSGTSIQQAISFFGMKPDQLLVVSDDLETAFGSVACAWAGGHRGQNGIRSVTVSLGTPSFWRLRIGIGRPEGSRSVSNWVLERFAEIEEARLPDILGLAEDVLAAAATRPRPLLEKAW